MQIISDAKGVKYFLEDEFEFDQVDQVFRPKMDESVYFSWEEAIEMGIADPFDGENTYENY